MAQEPDKERSSLWKQAYPDDLKNREEVLLGRRPQNPEKAKRKRPPAEIGLALSGGGIRSATFALGVIQALAKDGEFKKIDVLSTVSGGGYTGSLISRLFTRREVKSANDVEQAIQAADGERNAKGGIGAGAVLRWLRENGQHLAPNGSGDLLLAGAIMLRNWLSIHVVLATLVLTAFVAMQLVRNGLHDWLSGEIRPAALACFAGAGPNVPASTAELEARLTCYLPLGESHLWWSPWLLLPLLILVVAVVPLGWAYWLVADYGRKSFDRLQWVLHPLWGFVFIVIVALTIADIGLFPDFHSLLPESETSLLRMPARVVLVSAAMTLVILAYVFVWSLFQSKDDTRDDSKRRRLLSSGWKVVLVVFGVTFGCAMLDTLGQTAYVMWRDPAFSLGGWFVSMLGGLVTAAAGARQIAAYFPGKAGATRIRPSLNVVAMIGAVLLFTVTLTALNALSHGIAWGFKYPYHVPEKLVTRSVPTDVSLNLTEACSVNSSACSDSDRLRRVPCKSCAEPGERDFGLVAVIFVFLLVLSLLFGISWPFLNNSTLLPFYTARLTRAYLGASNPRRIAPLPIADPNQMDGVKNCSPPVAVTEVQEGDDMWIEEQWWSSDAKVNDTFLKGAPLHLVNVTINETLSGVSRVQRNDRRGVGMAVGPAGISAGIRHHVVFRDYRPEKDKPPGKGRRRARIFPDKQIWVTCKGSCTCCRPFRMFAYESSSDGDEQEVWYTGRSLTLGQWTGISGAAFSTGLGSRTSLGLSLIAGFFNVRLGLWWNSGLKLSGRGRAVTKRSRLFERFLTRLFPVQSFLVGEFLSRFPGVARQWWYLSDGGHFENTGAYELIRRRLPLIVIVDAGADPDYTYDDLANLIRKARLDFGAEIEFLDHEALRTLRTAEDERYMASLAHFGSLEMLRRGPWDEEPVPSTRADRQARQPVFGPPDRPRRSLAHAALAWVRYVDEPDRKSLIVYLKPTLVGDEPPDITSYHVAHPNFPQQTTADQFFDEAQWESYRKLGQFIAGRVFADGFASYFRLLEVDSPRA